MTKIEHMNDDAGMESKTTVLMITCKKFEQLWEPFFILFKRYWPDCPYRFVMGTDVGQHSGIETIQVGSDLGWANNCINILQRIESERVLMFFDDFLPYGRFQNDVIRRFVRHAIDYNIGCLRFMPCPGPTAPWRGTESLGLLQPGDPYRLSLQAALWKRSLLLELLKPGENAWETEVKGTQRANLRTEQFVSVWRTPDDTVGSCPVPYIVTAVVKGIWLDSAMDLLRKEGIPMDKITKVIK